MIVRAIAALAVLAALVAGVLLLRAVGDPPPTYRMVLDNAFGLTDDADLKAAGVQVGKVTDLEVRPRDYRAVVTVEIDRPDFAGFRSDVFCSIEPQSLIGEYFVNCDPGTDDEELSEGSTIPVEQTATTIPPDLVNNIMRRPYRERFGIIIDELGRGFATRGPELQQVIRRAVPALRQTNRVLRILSDNRRTLESLTREADRVMVRLAANRDDVARFVAEARDTAAASADRRVDLAENIRLLPPFLRRLRPVLRDLGTAAERQTPALRDLRLAAPDLEAMVRRLGPFADASVPAVRSLGEASDTGREAMSSARPTIRSLRRMANLGRDPIRNLRFILEHLDDRDHAVEPNPLSPGGEGFTGLEAILQYPFVQSQAINTYDRRGYLLKLNILPTECSQYRDASVRHEPGLRERCGAALGPSAPGIDDGTGTGAGGGGGGAEGGGDGGGGLPQLRQLPVPRAQPSGDEAEAQDRGGLTALPDAVDRLAGELGPDRAAGRSAERPPDELLDFLLGGS